MPLQVPSEPFDVPHSESDIGELLQDLFVRPRKAVYKWSRITYQTAQVRLAYPGQHLASVVTGVAGAGTAARGDDLRDGSEVKSCSRADQLGSCKDCEYAVQASLDRCPSCGSTDIIRKTDSHWIFAISTQGELDLILTRVPRVVLVLFDRPVNDPTTIQTRIWEVWPSADRHAHFVNFLRDYFVNNYQTKVAAGLKPAPCNLHPLKYDFYLMNPVLTFKAMLRERGEDVTVEVVHHVKPGADRSQIAAELMPSKVLKGGEFCAIVRDSDPSHLASLAANPRDVERVKALATVVKGATGAGLMRAQQELLGLIPFVDETARKVLTMREKKIKKTPATYSRH